MAKFEFYGYSTSALAYNPNLNAFVLDSDFDPSVNRARIEIEDDDNQFDGDQYQNERGDDANQIGTVSDGAGNVIAKGAIYVEAVGVVSAPDGTQIELHRIEVEGQHIGYVSSQPLTPGEVYDYLGQYNVGRDVSGSDTRDAYSFYEQNSVPCFGPGTMITTQEGEVPVELLDTSQKVLTRDHGYQPILWVGRTKLPRQYFDQFPEERPLRVPAGALGRNTPRRDLCLTGDHRVLIRSAKAQLMYFSSEVLAPAKAWGDIGAAEWIAPAETVTLTHVLCASHEVIMAEGAWVESLFTGAETLRRLSDEERERLDAALPEPLHHKTTARPCLSRKEAVLLLSMVGGVGRSLPALSA